MVHLGRLALQLLLLAQCCTHGVLSPTKLQPRPGQGDRFAVTQLLPTINVHLAALDRLHYAGDRRSLNLQRHYPPEVFRSRVMGSFIPDDMLDGMSEECKDDLIKQLQRS